VSPTVFIAVRKVVHGEPTLQKSHSFSAHTPRNGSRPLGLARSSPSCGSLSPKKRAAHTRTQGVTETGFSSLALRNITKKNNLFSGALWCNRCRCCYDGCALTAAQCALLRHCPRALH
jgi:hypothetical protein